MSKNNFEELAQENEKKFSEIEDIVKTNITNRKDIWSFMAGIIELYVPRLFQSLIGGGTPSQSTGITNSDDQ